MNGGKTYDEKVKEINKRFGLSSASVQRYLNISRLSDKVKQLVRVQDIDSHTADRIATSEWDEKGKEEAAEILSDIDSGEKRRKILSEMKKYDEELTPTEAFDKVKKIERIKWYRWKPTYLKLNKAMDRASREWDTDYNGVIDTCVTNEFKRKRWL